MLKESFQNLLELVALERKCNVCLDKIKFEESRIPLVTKQFDQKEERLKELKDERKKLKEVVGKMEVEYERESQRLTKYKNQENTGNHNLIAMEKEMGVLEKKCSEYEDEILLGLEKIESLNEAEKDMISFIQGRESTLNDLKGEIDEVRSVEEKEIKGFRMRQESLLALCPEILQLDFKTSFKKFPRNPIAKIMGKSCENCRMGLNAQTIQNTHSLKNPVTCPICQSLLLPGFFEK